MNKVHSLIVFWTKEKGYDGLTSPIESDLDQGNILYCVELDEDRNFFKIYQIDYRFYYEKGKWSELNSSFLLCNGDEKLEGLITPKYPLAGQEFSFYKGKIRPYLGNDPVLKSIGYFCELNYEFDMDDFCEKTKIIFC